MTTAGARRLASTLDAAYADLADLTGPSRDAGQVALGLVNAPKLTGALDRSVRVEADGDGFTLAAGSSDVLYAGVIHNGWPRHSITAQPFLSKAIDRAADDVEETYAEHVDDALSQIKGD